MVWCTRRTLPVVLGCLLLTRVAVRSERFSSATPEDKRIFGVLPNYRTAEASISLRSPLGAAKDDHRL